MVRKDKIFLIVIMVVVVMFTACKHEKDHPGYVYMPDMAYSEPAEAYAASEVLPKDMTNQLPVEGTIPRDMIPYDYPGTFDGQQQAGLELINPVEATDANTAEGAEQYRIFCAICHGDQGKGKGHLYTSKLFTAQPTDLTSDFVQNKPDGEIYHVITLGSLSGLMGAHGGQIKPEDRWKIVHYVRSEFGSN